MTAPSGLARKSIGTGPLFFFCVGASGPMIVVAGGVVATYGATGVIGVPLSFLVLAGALAFFTIGYVAMVRYGPHAATFYALLARGLGRIWGMAGGTVALVAYNSIQISLYGLVGVTIQGFLDGAGTWWLWALVVWAVVGLLGVLHINVNARVLTTLLICEIGIIVLFDVASFGHAAQGITLKPLSPGSLLVNGIGGVFAFGIAAFLGYETGPFYAEEARTHRTVSWATMGALIFMGVFYAVSAWAMAVTVGIQTVGTGDEAAPAVVSAARVPDAPPIPLVVLQDHYGFVVAKLGNLLLITSVVAAMISIHNSVARYVFAMARERVLPPRLGRIRDGHRGGAPIGGSLLQSAVALIAILAFVVTGADPFKTMFTWLATLAGIGVGLLMFGTSLATLGFFRRVSGNGESAWQRVWAPAAGAFALAVILVITMVNLNSLLGTAPGSLLTWIPVGVLLLAVVTGLAWGQILRSRRPEIYRNIGVGEQEPLAVLEHALANVRV
jgi:amino acid transporter